MATPCALRLPAGVDKFGFFIVLRASVLQASRDTRASHRCQARSPSAQRPGLFSAQIVTGITRRITRRITKSITTALFIATAAWPLMLRPASAVTQVSATTRFTAAGVAADVAGSGEVQAILFPAELVTVGLGYPRLLEPAVFSPDTLHSTAIVNSPGGPGLFGDSWSGPFGSAAITLNEAMVSGSGLLYTDLNDVFARDSSADSTAIRHATHSQAIWQLDTSQRRATQTIFLKLHGSLLPGATGERWIMASGTGSFLSSGTLLGTRLDPFAWSLGFDGGSPGSRSDFFLFNGLAAGTVSVNDFVVGIENFSLDFQIDAGFLAPDDQTTVTLESTFNCAVFQSVCAAGTIAVPDPPPAPASVPAPLPLTGLLAILPLARRLRGRLISRPLPLEVAAAAEG